MLRSISGQSLNIYYRAIQSVTGKYYRFHFYELFENFEQKLFELIYLDIFKVVVYIKLFRTVLYCKG
jgi:hypothetical protein